MIIFTKDVLSKTFDKKEGYMRISQQHQPRAARFQQCPTADRTMRNNQSITVMLKGGQRLTVVDDDGNSLELVYTKGGERAGSRRLEGIKHIDLAMALDDNNRSVMIKTSEGLLTVINPREIGRLKRWFKELR